jgi:hypothetical protein
MAALLRGIPRSLIVNDPKNELSRIRHMRLHIHRLLD